MTSESNLNLLCWDGYDHPALKEMVSRQTGIQLNAETLVSDHAAAQRVMADSNAVDVLNINNPYPKKVLYPNNRIHRLDRNQIPELRRAGADSGAAWIQGLEEWGVADDGSLIGVCQRFGAFNLVINHKKISRSLATTAGFKLPEVTDYSLPYGILKFPEFNIFHICIAAGLNPFTTLTAAQLDTFTDKARSWFDNATMVTADSAELIRALVRGDISYLLSGGTFVAGAARLEGHHQIECITPASGPIEGKGAIAFVEVNALTKSCRHLDAGYRFLNYILSTDFSVAVATHPKVCNPVVQMQNKRVFDKLPADYLKAIQWQTLEEDISRCALYDIPPQFAELQQRLSNTGF